MNENSPRQDCPRCESHSNPAYGEVGSPAVSVRLTVLLAVALTASACGVLLPSPSAVCDPEEQACDQGWVTVTGPRDWLAPHDYVLEIGARGWPIEQNGGGGVVAVDLAPGERVEVRLVERDRCNAVVAFRASPGSSWVIRFAADGSAGVEDWTGRGANVLGPALGEGRPTDCVSL